MAGSDEVEGDPTDALEDGADDAAGAPEPTAVDPPESTETPAAPPGAPPAKAGAGGTKKGSGQQQRGPRQQSSAASHVWTAKARAAAAQRRRNQITIAVVASVVVIAAAVIIIVLQPGGKSNPKSGTIQPNPPMPGNVVNTLTAIPSQQLADASTTSAATAPNPITGQPPLTAGGLPEIVYVGAEYCPYCAAERWAVVTALSKFGTFTGLGETHSSSTDTDPNTPTFSFHGATYSSTLINFSATEQLSNVPDGKGSYLPLDTISPANQQLVGTYDQAPYTGAGGSSGGIPFIDFANKWIISGASYDPAIFAGLDYNTVASQAADPSSKIGQAVQAGAGQIVKDICQLTNDQPSNVCQPFASAT